MNSPRQKLAISSGQNSVAPFNVKIGCVHQLLMGLWVQPRKSSFEPVAVRSPKVWTFQANQSAIGTAADPINAPADAKNGCNVLLSLRFRILKIKAIPATRSRAMFVVLTRQVAASASPVQIARGTVGGSARKIFIKPIKAIPKQSGESKSLCIE